MIKIIVHSDSIFKLDRIDTIMHYDDMIHFYSYDAEGILFTIPTSELPFKTLIDFLGDPVSTVLYAK